MFIFKSSIVLLTFALAISFKHTSAASLPETDAPTKIELASNYGPVKEQINYNLQTEEANIAQAPTITSGDNSTDHLHAPVKGWFYRAVDFVENAFTGLFHKLDEMHQSISSNW